MGVEDEGVVTGCECGDEVNGNSNRVAVIFIREISGNGRVGQKSECFHSLSANQYIFGCKGSHHDTCL